MKLIYTSQDRVMVWNIKNKLEIAGYNCHIRNEFAAGGAGDCLGVEDNSFWRDHKSAKIDVIRTRNLIEKCDMAVIRFGDKYKQWNAAFDAGFCAASGMQLL